LQNGKAEGVSLLFLGFLKDLHNMWKEISATIPRGRSAGKYVLQKFCYFSNVVPYYSLQQHVLLFRRGLQLIKHKYSHGTDL